MNLLSHIILRILVLVNYPVDQVMEGDLESAVVKGDSQGKSVGLLVVLQVFVCLYCVHYMLFLWILYFLWVFIATGWGLLIGLKFFKFLDCFWLLVGIQLGVYYCCFSKSF